MKKFDFVRHPTLGRGRVMKHEDWSTSIWWLGSQMAKILYADEDIAIITNPAEQQDLLKQILVEQGGQAVQKGFGMHLGGDPELFITTGAGDLLPAFRYLPNKAEPLMNNPHYANTKVFWDGYQAEFTFDSDTCLSYVTDKIRGGLVSALDAARAFDPSAKLTYQSVFDVDLESLANENPEHIELGCSPSKNAYRLPPVVADGRDLPFRTSGAHLHFGLAGRIEKLAHNSRGLVRWLDATLGIISVSLFQGMEDRRRRFLYGRAGEFRLPKHGLEYRVLSSAMLAHPALVNLCYDIARCVVETIPVYGSHSSMFWTPPNVKRVQKIINELDVEDAQRVLKENSKGLSFILDRLYSNRTKGLTALIMDGAQATLDLSSMENNWLIDDEKDWEGHAGSEGSCVRMAFSADTTRIE